VSLLPEVLDHAASGAVGIATYLVMRALEAIVRGSAPRTQTEAPARTAALGPYRTSPEQSALVEDDEDDGDDEEEEGDEEDEDEEDDEEPWCYGPRQSCPRCGSHSAYCRNLGRVSIGGPHDYTLLSGATASCRGGKPHLHYECSQCHADWAEIPPEEYANDDIHKGQ
jgi:hypothetical protein